MVKQVKDRQRVADYDEAYMAEEDVKVMCDLDIYDHIFSDKELCEKSGITE